MSSVLRAGDHGGNRIIGDSFDDKLRKDVTRACGVQSVASNKEVFQSVTSSHREALSQWHECCCRDSVLAGRMLVLLDIGKEMGD